MFHVQIVGATGAGVVLGQVHLRVELIEVKETLQQPGICVRELPQEAAESLSASVGNGNEHLKGRGAKGPKHTLREDAGVGVAPRQPGEIGFAVVRGGDIVGEHTVLFAGTGERITLGHQATDRTVFARGALQAASWLLGQRPGRYKMVDVIGLKSII